MSEIYNIIEKKKLDVVKKPIEKSHGLPNECYTSNEYTKLERKKLFEEKWVVIGVASSLPNKGDAKPFDLLGIPIIILRDKNNKIRVFHNVCSHRGYKILQESCKIKNLIRCPYHSWSYDTLGNLVATPHIGGMNKHSCKKFDKSVSGLKEIRSYVENKNLNKHITFTGFRSDIPKKLPELDVFLITSKTEGLGTSVIDAFVCEVPVVATKAGGIPELVKHKITGLLADIKDAKVLAEHINLLFSGSIDLKEITKNQQELLSEFTREATAEKTLIEYYSIL